MKKIINLFTEAAPSSSEKVEEYVDRISHLAPLTMLQVNADLESMSKASISSVIINSEMIINDLDTNNYLEAVYKRFINHHIHWYENACWDCPELFNTDKL